MAASTAYFISQLAFSLVRGDGADEIISGTFCGASITVWILLPALTCYFRAGQPYNELHDRWFKTLAVMWLTQPLLSTRRHFIKILAKGDLNDLLSGDAPMTSIGLFRSLFGFYSIKNLSQHFYHAQIIIYYDEDSEWSFITGFGFFPPGYVRLRAFPKEQAESLVKMLRSPHQS